ncbi:hypothetical protein [Pseudonocardia aurantiaca]|uniref:Gas vesicle protein n=1 Tax=Pseudonocardia aurantiaca TaxID=75290 RepID=A0ABW4FFK5_9PSEU
MSYVYAVLAARPDDVGAEEQSVRKARPGTIYPVADLAGGA